MAWTITDGSGNTETCDQVMATFVVVNTKFESTGDENSTEFSCSLGQAVSGALFIGSYDLTFSLVGSASGLATSPPQDNVVITSNNTTATTPLTFVVN